MAAITYPLHRAHLAIVRAWKLTEEDQEQCSNYFILRWSTSHLLRELVDTNTPINKDGIPYLPIFFKLQPHELINYPDVFLSFRKHKNALNGYVLITPAYQSKSQP